MLYFANCSMPYFLKLPHAVHSMFCRTLDFDTLLHAVLALVFVKYTCSLTCTHNMHAGVLKTLHSNARLTNVYSSSSTRSSSHSSLPATAVTFCVLPALPLLVQLPSEPPLLERGCLSVCSSSLLHHYHHHPPHRLPPPLRLHC